MLLFCRGNSESRRGIVERSEGWWVWLRWTGWRTMSASPRKFVYPWRIAALVCHSNAQRDVLLIVLNGRITVPRIRPFRADRVHEREPCDADPGFTFLRRELWHIPCSNIKVLEYFVWIEGTKAIHMLVITTAYHNSFHNTGGNKCLITRSLVPSIG